MTTTGKGVYIGTPNGLGATGYAGRTNVFNIPMSASTYEVVELLRGDNLDLSGEAGIDVLGEFGGSGGLSLDIDPSTGGPQKTTAGQMFATERSLTMGIGLIPTDLNVGVETGISHSEAEIIWQIPWWPFP